MASDCFFSYDPDGFGIQFHATEAEARGAAELALDGCRDCAADDGWPDNTYEICWGLVRGRAQITERKSWKQHQADLGLTVEDGDEGRFDEFLNYELESPDAEA